MQQILVVCIFAVGIIQLADCQNVTTVDLKALRKMSDDGAWKQDVSTTGFITILLSLKFTYFSE